VNAHTHNPMTLLRGIADDLPLKVWLQQHIWPVESAVMGPAFVADGVTLAIAEMLRGGTTCCNENYFFPDVQAATYRKHGFRARVGLPVIDFPTAWASSDDEYFDRAGQVHDQWRDDPLIATAFAPHAPYTVNDANFERVRMLADQLDIPVHLHLHETAQEVLQSVDQYGQRPIARLDRLGLVNDRLIAVHMTQLTDAEIHLCAERGVSVVHCPESNLKLASGFCPVCVLQRAGVTLAIGTDGCASNNDLDMFSENRTAAILAKAVADDATALDAATTLRASTLGGARALGFGERIGSIEVGKQADLVCVDLSALETQPLHNVLSQLVYATGRQQVSDVWIAGKPKLVQRELVGMDLPGIIANARQWRERIRHIRA
uniref:TRZ/ATZ family hydrolase n=1 Tax=Stenotrophomonas sp. TaxID=69392 RepID=UPI00374CBF32